MSRGVIIDSPENANTIPKTKLFRIWILCSRKEGIHYPNSYRPPWKEIRNS